MPLSRRHVVRTMLLAALANSLHATQPPRLGQPWPASFVNWLAGPRNVPPARAFLRLVRQIQENRAAVRRGEMTADAAAARGGVAVSGVKSVPVLLAKFRNTGADPYPPANLQRQLFDGPWPTGTMADYYREISYGAFTVNGMVTPWRTLAQNDTFYEGPAGCNGLCNASRVADFLRETLTAHDTAVNFASYDNDGPDGIPNSGDDDGFVDFVAFVHPEQGGECGGNNNIWSHRFVLSGWGGGAFQTNDARHGGGFIQVDDYVIMPATSCDGSTMIEIGVFCHEFGHAFGLPDLYDTDPGNGDSAGLGNWDLMASGSYGGDGRSPARPVHMSAWSKAFLGWLNPTEVTSDLNPASIRRFEDNAAAFQIRVSPTQYYLVYNVERVLFDSNLPTAGLAILKINETVVNAGLANNRVNADENNQGVELMEADGRRDLDNNANRGDSGDLFPGSSNNRRFDNSSNPASSGKASVCDIGAAGDPMTAKLLVSTGACAPAPGGCSALLLAPPASGAAGWLLVLLPALAAGGWLLRLQSRRRPA